MLRMFWGGWSEDEAQQVNRVVTEAGVVGSVIVHETDPKYAQRSGEWRVSVPTGSMARAERAYDAWKKAGKPHS